MPRPPSRETPRSLTILGATGSVGRSTAALVAEQPQLFEVQAVAAGSRPAELARTASALRARFAAIADEDCYAELKGHLAGTGIEAAAGPAAIVEAAARPAEWVMSAVVGFAGLTATLEAIRRGAIVALANKECVVCAGELLWREARRSGAVILPVDSEHNAIFQVLGEPRGPLGPDREAGPVPFATPIDFVEKLVLTASGGPFRRLTRERMAAASAADALAHPTWAMGAKITIDSATMMNKGLEIIEAHHLFGLPEEQIEVVVHPQSILHSLVGFRDGSFLAQLGAPDMRIPIAHALGWPARLATSAPRLDLAAVGRLDFEPPDPQRFPALNLARRALRGGSGPSTMLNAANEVAVEAFLAGRIGYLDIMSTVEEIIELAPPAPVTDLTTIAHHDALARRRAGEAVARLAARRTTT